MNDARQVKKTTYTPSSPIVITRGRDERCVVTTRELVNEIALESAISASTIDTFLRSFVLTLRRNFLEGKNVCIAGLGQFCYSDRKERFTHNVHNGTITYTPPISKLRFRPTSELNKAILSRSIQMPEKELPDGMQFGERIRCLEIYDQYQKELSSLCNGKTE